MSNNKDEVLFVGTAEAEHVEMYLKAIWHIKERNEPVKISVIAKMLNVRQPSVVQMLKKLNEKELVVYNKAGVYLTETGEKTGYFPSVSASVHPDSASHCSRNTDKALYAGQFRPCTDLY